MQNLIPIFIKYTIPRALFEWGNSATKQPLSISAYANRRFMDFLLS